MRQKTTKLIVTFPTTTTAMAMESFCLCHHIPGRLIPLPAIITADCGMGWLTDVGEADALRKTMEENGLCYEAFHYVQL